MKDEIGIHKVILLLVLDYTGCIVWEYWRRNCCKFK